MTDPAQEHWLVLRSDSERRRYRLRAPGAVRVGRAPGCGLFLAHPSVSREHAMLEWMPGAQGGGAWRVTDRGSSAGTTVNGIALRAYQSLALEPGDRVGIGPVELDYVRHAPDEASTDRAHRARGRGDDRAAPGRRAGGGTPRRGGARGR